MEWAHIVITGIGLVLIYGVSRLLEHRWGLGQQLEAEAEIERVQEEREKIKMAEKHERVIVKKLITTYMILGTIWWFVYVFLMRGALQDTGVETWPSTVFTMGIGASILLNVLRGMVLQMGTQAMRIKEIGLDGFTKIFNVFVRNHFPLQPALIRQKLELWDKTTGEMSITELQSKHVMASEAARQQGKYYELDFEDLTGVRKVFVQKSRVQFMEELSVMDVDKIKQLVDEVVARRTGQGGISRMVSQALEVTMRRLAYNPRDMANFQLLIEGTAQIEDEEMRQTKIRELVEWLFHDRLNLELPLDQIQECIQQLAKIPPLPRTTEDGLVFGGYHAEFVELAQYDTKYAIVVLPYPWDVALKFEHRDWIDAANVPFPMLFTDVTWRVLDTLTIQVAPKRFEYCKIVMPVWTDHDLEVMAGMIVPHPLDEVTKREFSYMFQEKAADPLLDKYIETETKLQQIQHFAPQDKKSLGKQLRRLWIKFRNEPFQSLRAIGPYMMLAGVVSFIVGLVLGKGVF